MSMYRYEEAFGAADVTSKAMRQAMEEWERLYYEQEATADNDPCQRIAYTVVSKIVKTMFGEYQALAADPVAASWVRALDLLRKETMQTLLVGGECFLKPCPNADGFGFTLIPRKNVLVFARDGAGAPVDMGMAERSVRGKYYYTLLERRRVEDGWLTIENRLFRSVSKDSLGQEIPLTELPEYRMLVQRFRYEGTIPSLGLVQLKTPILNCVDGSPDGVAVFAPAVGLIQNINENEAQLCGEFRRGESRILASADLLTRGEGLKDHLFVGLDEDPEQVGITIFSPQLREQSFLNRKQEYLRNVESIIGLRRGMLSDANVEERTATEIASSSEEMSLTVIDFQLVWEKALREAVALCAILAKGYGLTSPEAQELFVDWGNGVLYDEDKTWLDYKEMVASGMIAPEVALGWRFNMPAGTPEDRAAIRERFFPGK